MAGILFAILYCVYQNKQGGYMDILRGGVLRPMQSAVKLGARAGEFATRSVLHNTVDVPGRFIRTFDGAKLAERILRDNFQDETKGIVDEIVERQEDYGLVDHNVVRYVRFSAFNGSKMAFTGCAPTGPYIEEIEEIMTDRGVRYLTVVKAIDHVILTVPPIISR